MLLMHVRELAGTEKNLPACQLLENSCRFGSARRNKHSNSFRSSLSLVSEQEPHLIQDFIFEFAVGECLAL